MRRYHKIFLITVKNLSYYRTEQKTLNFKSEEPKSLVNNLKTITETVFIHHAFVQNFPAFHHLVPQHQLFNC